MWKKCVKRGDERDVPPQRGGDYYLYPLLLEEGIKGWCRHHFPVIKIKRSPIESIHQAPNFLPIDTTL